MQRDIQSSHINREEILFEQDSSMGDQDDRNINPDSENVMFRLLDTLHEKNRQIDIMQQEKNRRMDMMLQLMAR